MGTKVNVLVKPSPDTVDLYDYLVDRVDLWQSATEGIGRFSCRIRNPNGIYSGAFTADDDVDIEITPSGSTIPIDFMRGYLDSCIPTAISDERGCYVQELVLSGRDLAQDLMNKMVNKYPGSGFPFVNEYADDIINLMLINAPSEIAFQPSGNHIYNGIEIPIISYAETGDEHLIEAIRKILELINFDAYVDLNRDLVIFPIGTNDSEINLVNGVNLLSIEPQSFNSLDIRNYIVVKGKEVDDGWTEGNSDDYTCESGHELSDIKEDPIAAVGAYSIKCVKQSANPIRIILTFPRYTYDYLPFDKISNQSISIWTRSEVTSAPEGRRLDIRLTDINDKQITYKCIDNTGNTAAFCNLWHKFQIPVGEPCKINLYSLTEILQVFDKWTGDDDFNWQVKQIEFIFRAEASVGYIDGLQVPLPMMAQVDDELDEEGDPVPDSSIDKYKLRDMFVNGRDCETQAEVDQLAADTLEKFKDTIEGLKLTAMGSVGIINGVNKWIVGSYVTITSTPEGLTNAKYRITDLHLIVLDEPDVNGQDFIAEISCVPYDQPSASLRLAYWKNQDIAIFRQQNDAIRYIQKITETKFDFWTPPSRPLAYDAEIGIIDTTFGQTEHMEEDHSGYPVVLRGLCAEKPEAGVAGRVYYCTDTEQTWLDNGEEWILTSSINAEDLNPDSPIPQDILDFVPGPPATPTGLEATEIPSAVFLTWNMNEEEDLSKYILYKDTSAGATIPLTSLDLTSYIDNDVEYGVTYYYRLKAIDYAGNMSGYSSEVSGSPSYIKPVDLQVELKPWIADFKMWEDDEDYGKLYWSAASDDIDIPIVFADGSTLTLDKNTTGIELSSTIPVTMYFYWEEEVDTLEYTTDFLDAVGEGKGLLCVVNIEKNGEHPSTILPFNSYTPVISTGALAAKSIIAGHLNTTEAVITNSINIADNIIVNDHIVSIVADKVNLAGAVYLDSWVILTEGPDKGKIQGTYIGPGTVMSDQITATEWIEGKKFRTAATGHRIEFDTDAIRGYNGINADPQFYLKSLDGKAYCGGGAVVLDEDGVNIVGELLRFYETTNLKATMGMNHSGDWWYLRIATSADALLLIATAGQLELSGYTKIMMSAPYITFQQHESRDFILENRTSDPTSPAPITGQIWYRTDV